MRCSSLLLIHRVCSWEVGSVLQAGQSRSSARSIASLRQAATGTSNLSILVRQAQASTTCGDSFGMRCSSLLLVHGFRSWEVGSVLRADRCCSSARSIASLRQAATGASSLSIYMRQAQASTTCGDSFGMRCSSLLLIHGVYSWEVSSVLRAGQSRSSARPIASLRQAATGVLK